MAENWPGLMTNADPHDLPPGAAVVQDNCYDRRAGELSVRLAREVLHFDDPGSADVEDSQIIATAAMAQAHARYVVFLQENGNVRIAKNPQIA